MQKLTSFLEAKKLWCLMQVKLSLLHLSYPMEQKKRSAKRSYSPADHERPRKKVTQDENEVGHNESSIESEKKAKEKKKIMLR